MTSKVPIAAGTNFFGYLKNSQKKNTVFWYKITDSTEKIVEKTTFFTLTRRAGSSFRADAPQSKVVSLDFECKVS